MSEGPLAIIAGSGALPWEAAEIIAPRRKVVVFALAEEAAIPEALPHNVTVERRSYGEIGKARKTALTLGATDLLFLGAIRARPDFRKIAGDWETVKLVPRILRALVGGDDTIVRNVLALFEAEGFRIVSVSDAAPELLAPIGTLGRHSPAQHHEADIDLGLSFLDAVSPFDMGQAVVVVDGRVIAMEGAEGTDAMLARCKDMRGSRRVRAPNGRGVLVKRAKRGQDMRADVPVVGADTLTHAVRAGLGGVVVGAGETILAGRAAMIATADKAGVFVVGR
ncbi:MAG: UDP-2,3-diacylglucosamine diphosphatase LpxI [Pseudomonadota bacterium]